MQSASCSFAAGQALAFRPVHQQQHTQRQQLHVVAKDSRIGKVPVPVPDKVTVTIKGQSVHVKVRRPVELTRRGRRSWRRLLSPLALGVPTTPGRTAAASTLPVIPTPAASANFIGCRAPRASCSAPSTLRSFLSRWALAMPPVGPASPAGDCCCGPRIAFAAMPAPPPRCRRSPTARTARPSLPPPPQGDTSIRVLRASESRVANQQHGLARTLLSNMVVGVSSGFTTTLNMIGVGYKASVAGSNLTLNLGYSHPIEMPIPAGVTVAVEKNTTVVVGGYDKEAVGQFSANIRSKREPEPYKGKGVR